MRSASGSDGSLDGEEEDAEDDGVGGGGDASRRSFGLRRSFDLRPTTSQMRPASAAPPSSTSSPGRSSLSSAAAVAPTPSALAPAAAPAGAGSGSGGTSGLRRSSVELRAEAAAAHKEGRTSDAVKLLRIAKADERRASEVASAELRAGAAAAHKEGRTVDAVKLLRQSLQSPQIQTFHECCNQAARNNPRKPSPFPVQHYGCSSLLLHRASLVSLSPL